MLWWELNTESPHLALPLGMYSLKQLYNWALERDKQEVFSVPAKVVPCGPFSVPPPSPKQERTHHSNWKAKWTGRKSVCSRNKRLQSRATVPRSPAQETRSRWIKGEMGSWVHSTVGSHPPYLKAGGNQAPVLFPPTSQSTFTVYEDASGSLTALRLTIEKSISPSKDFPCPHAEVWIRHKSRWVRRSLYLSPQMLIQTWLHSSF